MAHSRISGKLAHMRTKRSWTTSLAPGASARVWQIMSHQLRRPPTSEPADGPSGTAGAGGGGGGRRSSGWAKWSAEAARVLLAGVGGSRPKCGGMRPGGHAAECGGAAAAKAGGTAGTAADGRPWCAAWCGAARLAEKVGGAQVWNRNGAAAGEEMLMGAMSVGAEAGADACGGAGCGCTS